MHMRTKKWARPELQACPFYIDSIKGPDSERGILKGTWRNRFAKIVSLITVRPRAFNSAAIKTGWASVGKPG